MMKNKFGFTIIELIVSISILSLISFFAINSFNNNLEKQSLNEELDFFKDILDDLESRLGNEITDYEIYISTGGIFNYTINKNYKTATQIGEFNSYTGTIKRITCLNCKTEIFLNEKSIYSTGGNNFSYNFSSKGDYRIKSFTGELITNELFVNHYSKIDLNKEITLAEIKDKDNISYDKITIKNSQGQKRQFLTSTGQVIDKNVKLFFVNNLYETTLEITK